DDPATSSEPSLATIASISKNQEDDFIAQSIEGGAITTYAESGAPAHVVLRWAKIDSAASGGQDTWALFYNSASAAAGGSPAWTRTGQTYTCGSNLQLRPPGVPGAERDGLTVDGVLVGEVELRHEVNGVSQFSDVNGKASVSRLAQNGYGAGECLSVAIN